MTPRPLLVAGLLAAAACSKDESQPAQAPEDAGPTPSGLMQTCARAPKTGEHPTTCNGAAELCDRTYDKVAVPMTHNAMSNADEGYTSPNQTHGIEKQLEDGIRGMMLDLHYFDPETKENSQYPLPQYTPVDEVYLCHSLCLLGKTRALDAFCQIGDFLDTHPGEVLTIIFETYVADADLDATLHASGLASFAYTHAPGTPWPTLRQMIDQNKRLMVFVETGGGNPPYIHPAYVGNIHDTPYDFENASQFTCALNRGKAGDPLFLINHWLGNPLPKIDFAREVNVEAVLGKRVSDCTAQVAPPTFVGVDFYEVGDLFSVVKKVNGL